MRNIHATIITKNILFQIYALKNLKIEMEKFNLWSRICFSFFLLHLKEFKNALPSHTLLLWTHTHFKLTKKIENIIVVWSDPTMARR